MNRHAALALSAFLLWSHSAGAAQPTVRQIREERLAQKLQQPPEVFIGERLFLETRFAQFFYTNCNGEINKLLPKGDPILATIIIPGRNYPSPFIGKAMSCRVCHLVDEMEEEAGMRTYADFAKRSPIPRREDGKTATVRNSQSLVNALIPRPGPIFLHYDGEFTSAQGLIKATYTGRNFGWLPQEQCIAVAHIANVIRKDNGSSGLAEMFGGDYARVFLGTDPDLPERFRVPKEYRLDVMKAGDARILDAIAKLVEAYLKSLTFAQDENGEYCGSPYDLFLKQNGLPRKPAKGETDLAYSRRLLKLVGELHEPKFVTPQDGRFVTHTQPFQFGPDELEGLKRFFSPSDGATELQAYPVRPRNGGCVVCHLAPHFTDFSFHNTGAAQAEYDAVHGSNAFAGLVIPDARQVGAKPELFLSATPKAPGATGIFREIPVKADARFVDLGLWSIFADPAKAEARRAVRQLLFARMKGSDSQLLTQTTGRFKVPSLRDLGHSAPYFHDGSAASLIQVVSFYERDGARAHSVEGADHLRPPTPSAHVKQLAAFLTSLNEDYD